MQTYDSITDFAETATIAIPGITHRLGTNLLQVHVKVRGRVSLIDYYLPWWYEITPDTFDVVVHLSSNGHRGIILLTRETPCYA